MAMDDALKRRTPDCYIRCLPSILVISIEGQAILDSQLPKNISL